MNFSEALAALKAGKTIRRSGWNGKGMWLVLVPGTPQVQFREGFHFTPDLVVENEEDKNSLKRGEIAPIIFGVNPHSDINPHIDMFTADGKMQPGWLASQTDMLADDWEEVPRLAAAA